MEALREAITWRNPGHGIHYYYEQTRFATKWNQYRQQNIANNYSSWSSVSLLLVSHLDRAACGRPIYAFSSRLRDHQRWLCIAGDPRLDFQWRCRQVEEEHIKNRIIRKMQDFTIAWVILSQWVCFRWSSAAIDASVMFPRYHNQLSGLHLLLWGMCGALVESKRSWVRLPF